MAAQTTIDAINRADRTTRKAQERWPDEPILLACSTNVLVSRRREPVGWSIARVLQRRCIAVFTSKRVLIESSSSSRMQVFWLLLGGYAIYVSVSTGMLVYLALLPGIAAILFQRRPFSREIAYADLQAVAFGQVRGLTGSADLASLTAGSKTFHLALGQPVPDGLRERLSVGA